MCYCLTCLRTCYMLLENMSSLYISMNALSTRISCPPWLISFIYVHTRVSSQQTGSFCIYMYCAQYIYICSLTMAFTYTCWVLPSSCGNMCTCVSHTHALTHTYTWIWACMPMQTHTHRCAPSLNSVSGQAMHSHSYGFVFACKHSEYNYKSILLILALYALYQYHFFFHISSMLWLRFTPHYHM